MLNESLFKIKYFKNKTHERINRTIKEKGKS